MGYVLVGILAFIGGLAVLGILVDVFAPTPMVEEEEDDEEVDS